MSVVPFQNPKINSVLYQLGLNKKDSTDKKALLTLDALKPLGRLVIKEALAISVTGAGEKTGITLADDEVFLPLYWCCTGS